MQMIALAVGKLDSPGVPLPALQGLDGALQRTASTVQGCQRARQAHRPAQAGTNFSATPLLQ